MKLFFIHDHPFYEENDSIFSGGGLPGKIWDNYLPYFSEIKVFGRRSNNIKDKKIISSGNPNVQFKLTENYTSIKSLFLNFNRIRAEIKSQIEPVDLVLLRLPSVLGFIAGFMALKLNKKILVEQVGNASEAMTSHGSLSGKMIAGLFDFLNRYLVKKADYVSYVTQNKLQQDYPSNAPTVELSNVLITKIIPKEEMDFGKFSDMEFKIGLIGGFDVMYKGQDVLLKAIALLDENISKNISLYLVGKGDYDWLTDLSKKLNLEKNIKFIGSKESGPEIFDFLSKLTLYVQPSLTEGMPRALLEAMSVGCPAIGADAGGISDVVSATFIHKPGDHKTLSAQILKLYNDRKILVAESERSLEIVQPFLKSNLDSRRSVFYGRILKDLKNAEA